MLGLKETRQGLTFSVYVQARSAKIAIVGLFRNALKIKLTAPPVSGAANKQCITVLAKALDIPKSHIEIISGQTHRLKQICLHVPNRDSDREGLDRLKARLYDLAQVTEKKHLD